MRDDRSRLRDILRAIDRIQAETSQGRIAFDADAKLQVWVIYHLQIAGEACRGLSDAFRSRFPDPVWSEAVGLVEKDLPQLRELIMTALSVDEPQLFP